MPSIVTRPVITSMAPAIRLNWRTVVAVTWGWRQWKSVTISTIGEFRCGLRVVVLHNATLHDNGPPHLIFGEGIGPQYNYAFHAQYPSRRTAEFSFPSVHQVPRLFFEHSRNSP